MGVRILQVADGVTNLQMPDGRPYNEGDTIELAVAQESVLGRTPVPVDPEDYALVAAAIDSLVEDGLVLDKGTLTAGQGDTALWSTPLALADIAAGEVVRVKPEVAGTAIAWFAVVDTAVTTAAKAATLALGIDGTDNRTEAVILLTQTGVPTGGSSTVEVEVDGEVVGEFDIAFDDSVVEVQAAIDAVPALLGNLVAGGDVDAWTLTADGDFVDLPMAVNVDDSGLTGGTSPTLTATDSTEGGLPVPTGSTIALTSAAATPANKIIAGSTITADNVFDEEQELVIRASSVTAFVEGAITVYVLLQQA